MSTDMTM